VCRGRGRGKSADTREIEARWPRLSAVVVFPQKGHYPRTGALIL
jgi:hypothetical protein